MKTMMFYSANARHLTDFIQLKRSLGYKYITEVFHLETFDRYLHSNSYSCTELSMEIINGWTAKRPNETDLTRYGRMVTLKQFLSYLRDNGTHTPVLLLPKYPTSTFIPYIYSHQQVSDIFRACDLMRLGERAMCSCLFIIPCMVRMLYATGIRIGEAVSLFNKDVNLHEQYLTLRETKNTKDRYVPFDESLTTVCTEYLQQRKALLINGSDEPGGPFFVSLIGKKCSAPVVASWFRRILICAGIPIKSNGKGPRLHDLRHTFACHSFAKLAHEGEDLHCSWPYLSAYLGHQSLRATEQYIRLSEQLYPELLKGSEKLYVDVLPDITLQERRHHERLY